VKLKFYTGLQEGGKKVWDGGRICLTRRKWIIPKWIIPASARKSMAYIINTIK